MIENKERPKFSEEVEKEIALEDAIYNNQLITTKNARFFFAAIGLSLVTYIAVIFFYRLSFENAWIIGFPLFLILIILGYLAILLINFILQNATLGDYSRRKLKEIDKTLKDLEKNK